MSRNAIAFIAGLGTGYLSSQAKQKDRERQDKKDAQDDELHDARMKDIRDKEKEKKALQDAGAKVDVNENAATLDTSGKPVLYEDAGVANSDFRQARGMAEQTGNTMAGEAPKQTFAAGGVPYQDKAAAQTAADTANTPGARNQRIAAALYGVGEPVKAMQMESAAKSAKLTDIQLEQATQAQKHDKAFREISESIMRQGWSAVPKIYENYQDGNTATVKEDGKGGAIITLINGKGEPVGQKAYPNELAFITDAVGKIDPKLWVSMKTSEADKAQAQKNADRKNDREDKETDAKVKYYNAFANQKDAAASKVPVDKMSDVDKLTLNNINKQRDVIHAAIVKAKAEPMFDEKSPGIMSLTTQLDALNLKESALAARYNGQAAQPDPLGIRNPAPVAAPVAAPAPQAAPAAKAPPVAAAAGIPMPQQPAAAPKSAPKQDLAGALGISGKGSAIDKIIQERVPVIQAAAAEYQSAQSVLAAAAKSGDPQALQVYAQKVAAARDKFELLLKDMNPQQAEAVRKASGIYQ